MVRENGARSAEEVASVRQRFQHVEGLINVVDVVSGDIDVDDALSVGVIIVNFCCFCL